jgi:hypothetical protein
MQQVVSGLCFLIWFNCFTYKGGGKVWVFILDAVNMAKTQLRCRMSETNAYHNNIPNAV